MHARAILALPLALVALTPLAADELAEKVRAAVARSEGSVFMVKCLISFEMGGQSGEAKVEVPATVLDDSGLLVVPNPEQMLGGMAARATLQTKGFQLVLADGKELDAKSVGRDADTGLLFLRLNDPAGAALKPLASKADPLKLGDTLFLLRRLSLTHPEMICQDARVTSVIQKPRLMYLVSDNMGPGTLVLGEDGSLIGLNLVVRETNAEGKPMQLQVVLPMAQVTEIAKGIREGDEAAPEPPAGE